MKIKTSLPYSQESSKKKHIYKIKDELEVIVSITRNPLNLAMDELFLMAARVNKKRSFLFVSKILGKHIPVNPHVSLLGGAALAVLLQKSLGGATSIELTDIVQAIREPSLYAEEMYAKLKRNPIGLSEPHLFIGFAETATGLGHSMYDACSGNTQYLHTTRESIKELSSLISFEEEHSHATAHRCYAIDPAFFQGVHPVVLVDDEITTGKTALNMIRDLHAKFPRSQYVVASLLDWRSAADRDTFTALEQELGIEITCLSLIEGQMEVNGSSIEQQDSELQEVESSKISLITKHNVCSYFEHLQVTSVNAAGEVNAQPYVRLTGRFGLRGKDNADLDAQVALAGAYLKSQRVGTRTLCLGTGEFMYVPMRIAAEMGEGIWYQSTTRSPIHASDDAGYAIHSRVAYVSPEDSEVLNFLYNIPEGYYDECFVFLEREVSAEAFEPFMQALERTHTARIHLVHFSPIHSEVAESVKEKTS